MKLVMLSIFDSKVSLFEMPHFRRSKGEALREWQTACNTPETKMCKYPHDFALFELGTYDESNAKVEMLPTPVSLGLAVEFKQQPQTSMPLFPEKETSN